MKGLSKGTELILFEKGVQDSEWYTVQVAMNGVLSIKFEVPTPTIWDLLGQQDGEEKLASYLERQASTMIERYGDGRSPRMDPALLDATAA